MRFHDLVHSASNGDFLFHVKVMSRLFRGKFLAGLHQLYKSGQLHLSPKMSTDYKSLKNNLYKTDWVVYAKKAFGGPQQVLEYLGRYTHKICISNYRIVNITDTHVTFKYLDRKKKLSLTKTVRGEHFLRLFAAHILPKGFVKIRHFGFLSSRSKKKDLLIARISLNAPQPPEKLKMTTTEFIKLTTGKDPHLCPCCHQGEMTIIKIMPPIRGSPRKSSFIIGVSKQRKVKFSRS